MTEPDTVALPRATVPVWLPPGERVQGATLAATGIVKTFGGITAVDDVSLTAEPGQITALIGPNGAGKTTLFDCISGVQEPNRGHVTLGGVDLTHLAAEDRVAAGLARTFQRLELFAELTAAENLQVALDARTPRSGVKTLFSFRHRENPADRALVMDVLALLGIARLADTPAGALPTGQSRLVEIGRALCTRPRALLLDEPASGLDSAETERIADVLAELAELGLTVLLVEHDVELVMSLSSMVHVLDFGRLIASGPPEQVSQDPEVLRAYLGSR